MVCCISVQQTKFRGRIRRLCHTHHVLNGKPSVAVPADAEDTTDRQWAAEMRLHEVAKLLNEVGHERGYQTRIAKRLGVSRSTICRDVARLMRRYWGGKEAEERHREEVRRDQRIRDEDRWLRGLIEADTDEEDPEIEMPWEPQMLFAEEPERPRLPPPTPPCEQPIQVPRWLPPSRSRSTSRTFPESRRRR